VSSNNYQIYINKTLQLAETIVIKSSYTAQALNAWVAGPGGTAVDPDPTTWKYYLNLAGEYHSIDQVMTVTSLDTLEEIVFNKANLEIHRATKRAYQYGTDQYSRLVQRYRGQEQLILGILYPTDINLAVNARDGQILSYPPGLVEENEYSLIDKLQKWVYHFKQRWHVPGFDYVDELYHATMLGEMYALLVQAILTYRTAACNTNEAHSFHVKEYLASHGYLDAYVDQMTLEQALYFYRNIAYIEHHAGRNDTFDSLTEHIMTKRTLPLAEYTMKHDVQNQTETLYPEVVFRKRQLNLGIVLPENNRISVEQMLIKEAPLAPGNTLDVEDVTINTTTLMENSPSNVVATKVLESSVVDETNSSPWILSEILFNHWLYLSSIGVYTAYVNITNPKTNEKIPLTAKEAFVLALYVFSKTLNETLVEVPLTYASRVQPIPTPTVDDIYAVVDHKLVERQVAVDALWSQPVIKPLISIDAFYDLGIAINDNVQFQRRLIARQQHYERRAQVLNMVDRIYMDTVIELEPPGTLYSTWLSARNIDLSDLSRAEHVLLFDEIVAQATGASLHPESSLKDLQRAMVNMFTQLSSYGIQIIPEINDANIRKTDWPAVRVGDVGIQLQSHPQNPDGALEITDVRESMSMVFEFPTDSPPVEPNVTQYGTHRVEIDVGMDGDLLPHPTTYLFDAPVANIGITSPDPKGVVIPRGWISFVGIEYFLGLTPDQIGQIEDPYNPPGTYTPPTKIPLNQVVLITELLGLTMTDDDRTEPLSRSIQTLLLGKTYPQ
jgi:hypothetical protein